MHLYRNTHARMCILYLHSFTQTHKDFRINEHSPPPDSHRKIHIYIHISIHTHYTPLRSNSNYIDTPDYSYFSIHVHSIVHSFLYSYSGLDAITLFLLSQSNFQLYDNFSVNFLQGEFIIEIAVAQIDVFFYYGKSTVFQMTTVHTKRLSAYPGYKSR